MAARYPSLLSGAFKRPFDEQVRFFRRKLGRLVPTRRWDDIQRGEHDVAFMVAGAQKADLLADLAAAVDRVITEGKSIEAFRQDFRDIVERRGWHGWTGEATAPGRAWRTRIIYTTNARTSYAAGRLEQLQRFPYWIYRHNDSVRFPRPLHQAWDGLTLPRNHEWWRTHYPPNGWGCRCYVVGTRRPSGARRLGGDPEKSLPAGWDTRDPRTGAPPGIDKGWDYRPGLRALGRLRDAVVAMAEKAPNWPYDIATAYMRSVPESARDALAVAYRALPSVADDLRRYAQRIAARRENLDIPQLRTLGLVTADQRQAIRAAGGPDLAEFDWAVDRSGVFHVFAQHGDEATERARGQRAVTAADFGRLPELLLRFEPVVVPDGRTGIAIRMEGELDGERWVTVWSVRAGRRRLVLTTMYVKGGRR